MRYLLTVALLFLFVGCDNDTFQKVNTKNFSLELPGNMSRTQQLNDDAVLQYQNLFSELYTVVIEEEDETLTDAYPEIFENDADRYAGLKSYAFLALQAYDSSRDAAEELVLNETTINGALAVTTDLNFTAEGHKIYMTFTFIKGQNHFYQMLIWTLQKNQAKFKTDFDKIANSFTDFGVKKVDRSKK